MPNQSTVVGHFSEDQLFERWSDRWAHFLDDFSPSSPAGTISERLRDKVKSGNAERAIAGGHEGREILELLQNARDAIQSQTDGGRVYVGVYDEGVLVANTGRPFDMFDPDVEDAVTMIGESSKGDSDQEIGHKGVGLKSILATGQAFEIWTRHDAATDGTLRVRLSRAYVTAAVLSALGYETSAVDLRGEISTGAIQSLIAASGGEQRTGQLNVDIREDIGKLPLFDFPVPLTTTADANDPVADQAAALLSGEVDEWYGDPFRTAVFVEYEDADWQTILEAFEIPQPESTARSSDDRAERLWSYLSQSAEEGGTTGETLTPETLIQFGGIDSLLLERVSESTESVRERWDVERTTGPLDGTSVRHQTVTVEIEGQEASVADERFDQFCFPDTDSPTQLLVPRTATRHRPQEYPLYLYYPIENTRDIALPFCLHGHFTVETNRKDLSLNSLDENQTVLKRGVELVARVAEAAAGSTFGDRYPWILLPPSPERHPDTPSSQASLLTWFRAAVYAELRQRACVPTVSDDGGATPVLPAESLLHWNGAVRDGFLALYDVMNTLNEPIADSAVDRHFLTEATLSGCRSFPDTWDDRIKSLLDIDDAERFSSEIASAWAVLLGNHLSQQTVGEDTPHLVSDVKTARSLFIGTIEVILRSGSDDEELTATLETLGPDLEGVYLLPCQRTTDDGTSRDTGTSSSSNADSTPTNGTLLVPIEARSGPDPTARGTSRTRSVIWDANSTDAETEPPEVPREKSSFQVYFIDRTVEQNERVRRVLEKAGRPWGVRGYNGTPSYFRELLDTFATDESVRVKSLDFYFLAKQIHKLGSESTDLQTTEGSFVPIGYVESAVAQSDGDRRQNLRRRINLRNNRLSLLRGGGTHSFRQTILDDDWQRIRALANGEDSTEDWGPFDGSGHATWPAPTEEAWVPIAGALQSDDARERIAMTLSLFGASVVPAVRTVWMYGSGHPRTRGNVSWNPADWATEDFLAGEGVSQGAEALRRALAAFDNTYQQWITAPGRHPQTTAEHSNKCSVKTDRVLRDVFLATWIWCDDLDAIRRLGEANLLELLRRYDSELHTSILETGWTCSHGHQREGYGWTKTVPTLLNWQLRQVALWDSILTTDPELQDRWGDDTARFAYAVTKTGSRGARPSRLFPHVDPDDCDLSDDLLRTLGVKPVKSFDATEAAWHLQRLLEMLAVDTPSAEPAALEIPDERENDWNAAYTALLEPILRQLPAEDPSREDVALPFLTHLPIQRDDEWQVASLEWLSDNATEGRYYEDQSPKPWERRAVETGGYWLLPRTAAGPFTRLTEALGIERVDASKPIFEATELTFTDEPLEDYRSELRERTVLLVASLEQTSEDRIREFADDLDAAIADLRIAERFPEVFDDDLDAPTSGLYAPRPGEEAFVFNAAAYESDPTLDGLADAVALLAERPTTVSTFREVLDSDLSTSELTKRWQRRTFPVDHVERVLGTRRRRDLRQRLDALVFLVERFDESVAPSVDDVVDALERAGDTAVEDFKRVLSGVTAIDELEASSPQAIFANGVHESIPPGASPVLDRLFGEDRRPWREVIVVADSDYEPVLIEWLAQNARALDATASFPQSVLSAYSRLLSVMNVWDRTDTTELRDIDVWRSRLQALSGETSVEWTDPLPERFHTEDADGDLLFYYTPEERFRSLIVEPFLESLTRALSSETEELEGVLQEYILDGELPRDETTVSAADHQADALADLQSATESGLRFSSESLLDAEFRVRSASTRVTGNGGGGGGSTQYRGRGQQGEAATLVAILDDAATWLDSQPKGMIRLIRSTFRSLYNDQQANQYMWHLDRVWEQDLLPLLSGETLTREVIVNWRGYLESGQLRDHPLVQLCNVTLEQGPGFDVIDPFGPLSGTRREFDNERFVPVEVKAVGGRTPPFNVRFTTNEYRRCKAFLRDDRQYTIRLVYVPDPDTPNWASETRFVSEVVLENVSEAESLVRGDPFEEVVKGGYMNLSVDQ